MDTHATSNLQFEMAKRVVKLLIQTLRHEDQVCVQNVLHVHIRLFVRECIMIFISYTDAELVHITKMPKFSKIFDLKVYLNLQCYTFLLLYMYQTGI